MTILETLIEQARPLGVKSEIALCPYYLRHGNEVINTICLTSVPGLPASPLQPVDAAEALHGLLSAKVETEDTLDTLAPPPYNAGLDNQGYRKTMRPTSTHLKAALLETSSKVRRSFEMLMGWDSCSTVLDGQCERMSKSLAAALLAEGFEARTECGTYFGCDPSYEPDFTEWDEEAIEGHDQSNGYSHYWVVCESVLIDICSDQFHPNQRPQFRVVMEHEDFTNWQSDH